MRGLEQSADLKNNFIFYMFISCVTKKRTKEGSMSRTLTPRLLAHFFLRTFSFPSNISLYASCTWQPLFQCSTTRLPINDFGYFLAILHPGQAAPQYAIAFFLIIKISPLLKLIVMKMLFINPRRNFENSYKIILSWRLYFRS